MVAASFGAALVSFGAALVSFGAALVSPGAALASSPAYAAAQADETRPGETPGAGAPSGEPASSDGAVGPSRDGTLRAVDTGPDTGSVFDTPAPRLRRLGLMFDLGTMDGAMMSFVYRPLSFLRLHGGGGTNGAGPGVRAGAVLSPLRDSGWSLSLEGGHFFPGNVNGVFAAFAGSDYDDSHLLEHFDYDFVNLQAGWEVERGDLLFFARAGVGLLWTQLPSENLGRVRNLSAFVDPDGSVEAFLPSLKVGIIGFL